MKTHSPYGSWKSAITTEVVAGSERHLTPSVQIDGDDIYFVELRPDEGGRAALLRRTSDGEIHEVLSPDWNLRTRYLEYGGLSYTVHNGSVYFTNFADQEIYVARPGEPPQPLTQTGGHRFADLVMDEKRHRLIALREMPSQPESKNTICAIDLESGEITDLVAGADFYLSPRLRNDDLLWISWHHPNMAWNGTELFSGKIHADGSIASPRKIVGDETHAVCQAEWGMDGAIYFVAELDNWLNLYRFKNGELTNLFPMGAEFASPAWVPGDHQYVVHNDQTVWAMSLQSGRWQILRRPAGADAYISIGRPLAQVAVMRPYQDGVVLVAQTETTSAELIFMNGAGELRKLYSKASISEEEVSIAEEVQYPTRDGSVGYAWYYPPKNAHFEGPAEEKPPLIVRCHGGPTAMSSAGFNKSTQFWTNRGYAVVDVNYGGSTGFGRAYRERLRGNWGLVDVQDAQSAVETLAKTGKIDPQRVAIRGGSAGGYTTLAALTFTKEVFRVGASFYGVSDLELLAKETHKLESRYMDQLVGPYPQAIATYKERAPLEHVDGLSCPIIFFQGDEDKVVPPNQSQRMYECLIAKGIPTEYHLYAKEGHGFRRSENLQHSLKAEHGFYARFFNFEVQSQDRL